MAPTSVYLGWNSARLIALILNSLTGLEHYYETHYDKLNVDGLFGLRVVQGQLKHLYMDIESQGIDSEIINEMRNLSECAGEIANRAIPFVADREFSYYKQFRYLLTHPYDLTRPPQRTDETLRWMEKQRPADDNVVRRTIWFNESCFAEVLSKDYNVDNAGSVCSVSDECMKRMFGNRGLSGYGLTHQILFASVLELTSCDRIASNYLLSTQNITLDGFIKEYCTNMIEELLFFQKNARNLARLNYYRKDLLMEQVFACGQYGFVETSSLHLLVSFLSWQHPSLGCFTKEKPEDLPGMSIYEAHNFVHHNNAASRRILNDVVHEDYCSSHSATVAAGALVVFLRFLMIPGPWPEFFLANQPVTVRNILAEDRFQRYNYARWVRNSFPYQMRFSRPPSVGWSPDLLAYILLLIFVIGASMCSHLFCKRKSKQMYHFAYKKL